jgi:hypothetical protein
MGRAVSTLSGFGIGAFLTLYTNSDLETALQRFLPTKSQYADQLDRAEAKAQRTDANKVEP